MAFGADEKGSPEVVAEANSEMQEEMRAVYVEAAAVCVSTVGGVVEDKRFATNSGHQVGAKFRRHAPGIDGIGIVQNGTVELVSVVETFFDACGTFEVPAQPPFTQILQARIGEGPTLQRGRDECLRSGK